MRKIIFSLYITALFLCGCASLDSGKLSEFDQLTIIDMARYTITGNRKNKKFVTAAEGAAINKKMPEVKIRYTGPRQGRMLISWQLKNKTVNFVYSGQFLTDRAIWQMGIIKHDSSISKNEVDPFRKRRNAVSSDFDGLRKKDKTIGKN